MDRYGVPGSVLAVQGFTDQMLEEQEGDGSGYILADSRVSPIASRLGQIQFGQPTFTPGAGVSGNLSYEALSPDKSAVGWTIAVKTRRGRRQPAVLTLQIGGRDYSEQEARELAAAILIALDQAVSLMRPVRSE